MSRHADVVIVGGGPRSTGLIAALARLRSPQLRSVSVVDPLPDGAGSIWRGAQPALLLANSPAAHIRGSAHDGPSFLAWCRTGAPPSSFRREAARLNEESFPTRRLVGEYLRQDAARVDAESRGVVVSRVPAWVESVSVASSDEYAAVRTGPGQRLTGRVVLAATGSGHIEPYAVPPGSRAQAVPLSEVPPGALVWVRGMGLTFHDVLSVFTEHRGGRYQQRAHAGWVYRPSGREPRVVASSRSGMPIAPKVGRAAELPPETPDTGAAIAFVDESAPLIAVILGEIRRRLVARGIDPGPLAAVSDPESGDAEYPPRPPSDPAEYVARWARATDLTHAVLTSAIAARALRDFVELTPALSSRQLSAVEHVGARLSSGPPLRRFRQLDALVRARIVSFPPPSSDRGCAAVPPDAWIVRAHQPAPRPPFDIETDEGTGWPVDPDGRIVVDPVGNRCAAVGTRHHVSILGEASSFPLGGGLPTHASQKRFRSECDAVVRSAETAVAARERSTAELC